MAEPFKNLFNETMIAAMGDHFHRVDPGFDRDGFCAHACDGLNDLELKARSNHIRTALQHYLPEDFHDACALMVAALHPVDNAPIGDMAMDEQGIRGWPIMPMADFVAQNGLQHFDYSLDVLAGMTKRFSAEFAIRPFFLQDWQQTLKKATDWARDDNLHLRRLASEGSRPRLPWGLQIPQFVEDPTPLLPLLELLRDDVEEYVRRSVANNLNDIAKDHPDTVARLATKWLKNAGRDRTRLVKHACRSLVKQGHGPTLKALGYGPAKVKVSTISLAETTIELGQAVEFKCEIYSLTRSKQPLIIDFIIHHQRANGTQSAKVFKWKTVELAAGQTLQLTKKHSMKPVTTRSYYAGTHGISVQINGKTFAHTTFELQL